MYQVVPSQNKKGTPILNKDITFDGSDVIGTYWSLKMLNYQFFFAFSFYVITQSTLWKSKNFAFYVKSTL